MLHSKTRESLKLCAYRAVWQKRNELTPKSLKALEDGKKAHRITWAEWFEKMYGENVETYHAKLREQSRKSVS